MRKAGPAHVVNYHRQTAAAVSAATLAQNDAHVAIQNEELTRRRVAVLEGYVFGLSRLGFWGRVRAIFAGFPAFEALSIPDSQPSDKNCLDTTKNGVKMGAS